MGVFKKLNKDLYVISILSIQAMQEDNKYKP